MRGQQEESKNNARWGVATPEQLRELFEASRAHRSLDHDEELFRDDDADCCSAGDYYW